MLVITRRLDQEIVIGHDIRLKVVGIGGNRVRLGIAAPREVPIQRAEGAVGFDASATASSEADIAARTCVSCAD